MKIVENPNNEYAKGSITFTKEDVTEDGELKWDYNFLLTYHNLIGIQLGDAINYVKKTTVPDIHNMGWSLSFKGAPNLEELVLGSSNVNCENCVNLKKVKILELDEKFGIYSFAGCTSLTEIVIPEGTGFICHDAFKNCTSLKYVKIGLDYLAGLRDATVNSYFEGCTSLKEISFKNKDIAKQFWMNSVEKDPKNFLLIETDLYKDAEFVQKCLATMKEEFMKKDDEKTANEKCEKLIAQKTELEREKKEDRERTAAQKSNAGEGKN